MVWGDWGKVKALFSSFYVGKTSEKPFRAKCLLLPIVGFTAIIIINK